MNLGKRIYRPVNIILAVAVIVLGGFLYTRLLYHSSETKILETLRESSGLNVQVMQKEVEKEKKIIANTAALLGQDDVLDVHAAVQKLISITALNSFKRMGIILPDGTAYTTDHLIMNLDDRDYFSTSLQGETSVSDTLRDKADGDEITVYSSPIVHGGSVLGVLFATYSTDWYSHSLSASTFGGTSYTCIVKSNGDFIVGSSQLQDSDSGSNLFDTLLSISASNSQTAETLRDSMAKNSQGNLEFAGNVKSRLYFQPLEINDWYLLTVVPAQIIESDINRNLIQSYIFVMICAIAFIFLIFQLRKIQLVSRKQLEEIAFVDKITGGSTYDKFKLDVLELCSRYPSMSYALVCLNIEKFKYINDLYSYEEGDQALRFIWNTIHNQLYPHETLTRRTADQFSILMSYQDHTDLVRRITALYENIRSQHIFSGKYYRLKPAIGIYQIRSGSQDIEYMVDRANIALNSIKYHVFDFYAFYDEKLDEEMKYNQMMEDRFDSAVEAHEFIVYYQPKYSLLTNRFEGAEALVRWQTRDLGMMPPAVFIPLFEKNGSILTLDQYVFTTVCQDIRRWLDQGIQVAPISVNLSRLHLYQTSFIDQYISILNKYQIPRSSIQLELTETVFFNSEDILTDAMNHLRQQGIKILMDDFGSGYSSINMLKNIPIDILKLDKGLIDDTENSPSGQTILKYIISLSHELGLKVVAEGVETKEQFDILDQLDCDYIQGYYCSRPMDTPSYEALIKDMISTKKSRAYISTYSTPV